MRAISRFSSRLRARALAALVIGLVLISAPLGLQRPLDVDAAPQRLWRLEAVGVQRLDEHRLAGARQLPHQFAELFYLARVFAVAETADQLVFTHLSRCHAQADHACNVVCRTPARHCAGEVHGPGSRLVNKGGKYVQGKDTKTIVHRTGSGAIRSERGKS
jgi:hypothetical protein